MDTKDQEPLIESCSEFSARVKLNYQKFSSSERRVAEYLLKNEVRCQEMTIYQMAEEIGTSVATITRFSQTLGYHGLADMKFNLQQSALNLVSEDMGIRRDDNVNVIKQKALQYTQTAMQECVMKMNNAVLEQAIHAIGHAGYVMLCGIGSASGIVHAGVGLFLTAGINASFVEDTLLQMRSVAMLQPGDVLIAISYDGYAKDIGDAMMLAREKKVHTILITSVQDTLLANYAEMELYTPARSMGNAMSITATSMCQLAVLQSLMVGVVAMYYDSLSQRSATQLHLSEIKRYDYKQTELHIGRMHL